MFYVRDSFILSLHLLSIRLLCTFGPLQKVFYLSQFVLMQLVFPCCIDDKLASLTSKFS